MGPRLGGGAFNIRTDPDSELIVSLSAGLQRGFGARFFLQLGLRADQHFADWKLTDRISGATGSVDDYLAFGGNLGFGLRF